MNIVNTAIHTSLHKSKHFFIVLMMMLVGIFINKPIFAAETAKHIGYVPISAEGAVYVIDTAAQKVIKKINDVGMHPTVLRMLPDQSKIYVDNFGPYLNQVSVISTTTNQVVKKIATSGTPFASMQLSPDGRYLYVPTNTLLLQVIDTRSDMIVSTFKLPAVPLGVEVDERGLLYIMFSDSTVGMYDPRSGAELRPRISTGGTDPGWATFSADGKKLYIANALSDNLGVLDVESWKIVNSISVGIGGGPISVTLSPQGDLYVCNTGTRNIVVVDGKTEKVKRVIQRDTVPVVVGFSPDGSKTYLSDLGTASVGYMPGTAVPLITLAFFSFIPGMPSKVVTLDTATGTASGTPIHTGTGPVLGIYF